MMRDWSAKRKTDFRGEMLTLLAGRHLSQKSRMDDVALCQALQSLAWDCELNDVVTILQDMQGRGWVRYSDRRNKLTLRLELYNVEICPEGQDIVDDVKRSGAVTFL